MKKTRSTRLLIMNIACCIAALVSLTHSIPIVAAQQSDTTTSPSIRTLYLLLDSRIIDCVSNASLVLGKITKHPANPLFREDKPWEQRFDNLYPNVIYNPQTATYQCWYNPFIISNPEATTPRAQRGDIDFVTSSLWPREVAVCYAASKDGITWLKSELGIVEYEGTKGNNIVLRRCFGERNENGIQGAGVFRDDHEPDPARRYKMVFLWGKELAVSFSSDGLNWGDPISCPGLQSRGDTHNNAIWVPELSQYVLITRKWTGRIRQVARSTSNDFTRWTPGQIVLEGLERHLQVYSMPIFHYGGVYLGLPAIYNTNPDVGGLSVGRANRKDDPGIDRVHTELAWSPDTITWHRICPGTPLIPCSAEPGAYDWGCVYAACPIMTPDTIRIYYGANNNRHTDWRDGFLSLATLRPDGFAGYQQISTDKPAVITTHPMPLPHSTIRLTADIQPGGSVALIVSDRTGRQLAAALPITDTATDTVVSWPSGSELAVPEATACKLTFLLDKATLYSYSFTK